MLPGDRWPRRHVYEFTTLDTARPEHRTAIALLDAMNMDESVGYVELKRVGSKSVSIMRKELVYVVETTMVSAEVVPGRQTVAFQKKQE
jgi:hypothetical protein